MGEFARLAAPEVSARMSFYYFDLRSADSFSQDPDGIELPDVEAAHDACGCFARSGYGFISDLLSRFATESDLCSKSRTYSIPKFQEAVMRPAAAFRWRRLIQRRGWADVRLRTLRPSKSAPAIPRF
jgi:uncharacterized protein DUF6894